MEHTNTLLNDIAICIVAAWVMAMIARWLKQPLIIAYLIAGFVIGPLGLTWVGDQHSIETISELGLIFLLFMIGLEIDLKQIAKAGRHITVTALCQILGCFLIGLGAFWLLGFPMGEGRLDAVYLAVAAALSSTVIIVKILYDKREIATTPGRITLGVLVLQDIFAIIFMAVQSDLQDPSLLHVGAQVLKVGVLVAAAFVASRYALPTLFRSVARLPELVLVGALAWCFMVAGLALALDLSREMGALIAGVALSTFPYTLDVAARINTLRDFFVTLFFVSLGMLIPAPSTEILLWALVLGGVLTAARIITVFLPLLRMHAGHRASLLPAINLSQVSEFTLVILSIGLGLEHVDDRTFGIISYAFVIMATLSGYGITYSETLLNLAGPLLKRMGLNDLDATNPETDAADGHDIYLLGFSWTASSLLEEMTRTAPELLPRLAVVDFNPLVHQELKRRGIHVIYGDIARRDTLLHAHVDRARTILCTLPDSVLKGTNNLRLARDLRAINPKASLIMHAEFFRDVPALYAAGADYVSLPRVVEAAALCNVLRASCNGTMDGPRRAQEAVLNERHEVIP